ncbi:MAG: DUF342 domain-containing protein [Selenomonadaceae bacterium]|nr:DUF342 domain-containing protein [Selenomonadaceae bacterium]MBQ6131322.1 DUF342 domain-containing protein [Selenomonadaceae bacterium]
MSENLILGGPASGYKYEFRPDGVYLTVYPNVDGERLFELSDMRQILRDCRVLDYDVGILSRTMREANGRAQRIAEPVQITEAALKAAVGDEDIFAGNEEEEPYARLVVEMTRDRMKATIRYDTREGARLPTKEMVMAALSEAGVVYGINEDAIEIGIRSLTPFVAAEGLPPIAGENAYIDRKFNLGVQGKPIIDEAGRADYKDLNLFVLAKENQTLAIRIPQTKGTPGKNILGEPVPAQNGRPCPMPEGKNTKVVGEHRLIATVNGQIVDKGSRISVDPRLEIKGGVGVSTGDIEFDGTVQIKGDVEQGFKVKATGDIDIKGSINGAEVTGRNVYISGGITGADRAKVFAEHDVRTAFAENALIEAGNDVFIADIALHSQIRAGKRLIMEDKHGQITGGHAVAGEMISVKTIGNTSFVVTRVSVGVDPNLQKEYQALRKTYKESKRRLTHITQTLNTLSKIDINKLPKSRVESINALTRSQFPLAGQIKRDEKRILEIEAQLTNMKNGKIRVSGTIYPGTRLSVNSIVKSIQSEYKHCSIFLNDEGEVEVGTY